MVFFFFFGGVTEEVKAEIERGVARCPLCKSEASLVEYENVFRAFFIPLWRWGGDNPAIKCTSCPFLMPLDQFTSLQEAAAKSHYPPPHEWSPTAPVYRCWSCRAPIDVAFKFCPQCGSTHVTNGLDYCPEASIKVQCRVSDSGSGGRQWRSFCGSPGLHPLCRQSQ